MLQLLPPSVDREMELYIPTEIQTPLPYASFSGTGWVGPVACVQPEPDGWVAVMVAVEPATVLL